MKEIIKRLEEEKRQLELKIITVSRIIGELKEMSTQEKTTPEYPESIKVKRERKVTPKKERVSGDGKKGRPTKYTPEVMERIRQLHGKMSIKEMAHQLNREFRDLDITASKISVQMSAAGITKKADQGKRYGKSVKRAPEGQKPSLKRARKSSIFTKEIIDFMKECSKTMTSKDAHGKVQIRFEHPFNIASFRQAAKNNGIKFPSKEDLDVQCDRETFEIIKKNRKFSPEEIESKIIEKTEKNFGTGKIRKILKRLEANSDVAIAEEIESGGAGPKEVEELPVQEDEIDEYFGEMEE